MSKTPLIGPVAGAMLLATVVFGAAFGLAAPDAAAMSRASDKAAAAGFNAWDGHRLAPDGVTAVGEGDLGPGPAASPFDDGSGVDATRPAGDYTSEGGASKLANLNPDAASEALPLSQFAGAGAKPAANHAGFGVWDFVNRVRYGRLPEPASWALMLIGFGMIGGALRGFVVANRRLARLQPEDGE